MTSGHWHLWHCPTDLCPPGAVPHSCVECNPLHWARGNSLNHITNRDVVGSNAQKQWRSKLYRTLKQQRYERDNLELQKRREREVERQQELERAQTPRPTPPKQCHLPKGRWRGGGRKKSDIGRTYK